ncbi:MAG: hypothetical protein PHW10_02755 [Candidatus Peribacteraceae bacterium]|nr:hypothetical protein [Candidatus Peribacteraceae bacterium]
MSAPSFVRRGLAVLRSGALLLLASAVLTVLSILLLREHAVAIRAMNNDVLPLAARATALEGRLEVLRRQVEASTLAAAMQTGSQEERLRMYVFPAGTTERTVAFLNGVVDRLRERGDVREASAIRVGEPGPYALPGAREEMTVRPLSLTLVLREDGVRDVLRLLELTGLLTVYDALSPEQVRSFLALTEAENPTGVVALGQFLSADLLAYLREPRGFDDRFLASFSSEEFPAALRGISSSPAFRAWAEIARGQLGTFVQDGKLWPLPFLALDTAALTREGEWQRLELTLSAVQRKAQ